MQNWKKINIIVNNLRRMSRASWINFTKEDMQSLIPTFITDVHKGLFGCIGVIGGSREYTGAPYFAAMTTLRLGADLAHVFCSGSAGTAIKGYSPDLIVHPILDDEDALEQIKVWLPRLHAVVVGPGLGRDEKIIALVGEVLNVLKEMEKITVIDADALHIVTGNLGILENFKSAVLTPNAIEYKRLLDAVDPNVDVNDINFLARTFNGPTIVKKGARDEIFDLEFVCEVEKRGSPCRCGGQGDVLSGAIALFSYWSKLSDYNHHMLLGAFCGCYLTRCLSKSLFSEKGRSMVTGDFIEKIDEVFNEHFIQ